MARILTEETSLTRKRKSLLQETQTLRKLLRWEAAAAGASLLIGIVVFFWRGSGVLLGCGLVLAIICLAHRLRVQQNDREVVNLRAGLKGEVEVTRQLAESLDNSHYIFNDLRIKAGRRSAQIDHLVVSPRGIFLIETKNWRGHLSGTEEDDRWTQTKREGEPPIRISNPIQQTKRHADVLRIALDRESVRWPDLHPMVVFLSPRTTFDIRHSETPVLHPREAVEYVASYRAEQDHSEEEINAVINLLMRCK